LEPLPNGNAERRKGTAMSNDTALSIVLVLLLAMTFLIGFLAGYMRRDTEWTRWLRREQSIAEQSSAEIDSHWETAIR